MSDCVSSTTKMLLIRASSISQPRKTCALTPETNRTSCRKLQNNSALNRLFLSHGEPHYGNEIARSIRLPNVIISHLFMTETERMHLQSRYEHELFERVLPFWEMHSPDPIHGGYFNNLDRDGTVYDTTKHIWLLARQVWMFSKLYRLVEQRESWLSLATSGMNFLRNHALRPRRARVFCACE